MMVITPIKWLEGRDSTDREDSAKLFSNSLQYCIRGVPESTLAALRLPFRKVLPAFHFETAHCKVEFITIRLKGLVSRETGHVALTVHKRRSGNSLRALLVCPKNLSHHGGSSQNLGPTWVQMLTT